MTELNELDKLRTMLTDAGIPFESKQQLIDPKYYDIYDCYQYSGPAGKWQRNQVIYGMTEGYGWLWDGICQYGSYGADKGLIESWGELVKSEPGSGGVQVVTAEEAFEVIKSHYDEVHNGQV